jgi:hypothetical protein
MGEKWDVSSWDARIGDRAKQHNGCFESRVLAERFVTTASREHPDRTYRLEQCRHSEQTKTKTANA